MAPLVARYSPLDWLARPGRSTLPGYRPGMHVDTGLAID
jgi:hypothetical protein